VTQKRKKHISQSRLCKTWTLTRDCSMVSWLGHTLSPSLLVAATTRASTNDNKRNIAWFLFNKEIILYLVVIVRDIFEYNELLYLVYHKQKKR
jgi:hypothetical protein